MEKKKILPEIIITELFLVKSGNDFTRTFIGEIQREADVDGSPLLIGKVTVEEGYICGMASCQEYLMKNMDSICKLKLDGGLHSHTGLITKIFGTDFYLN